MELTEKKGIYEGIKNKFELVGTVNRIINQQGEEEFCYFCRDLDNKNIWHSKMGSCNGCPLDIIKNSGQIIMLFYNKC